MDIEELEPRKQTPEPKDLSIYSVEELRQYIDMLKAEIARAELMLNRKDAHKDAASAFFKK